MKHIIVVFSVFVALRAQEMTIPVGVDGRDTLTTIRVIDNEGNYDVGYNENQYTGGASFLREKGDSTGRKEGSYGYTTRSGLIRIVTYVADENGFRAEVLTNEPGVDAKNPSSVNITKEKEPDLESLASSTPSAAVSPVAVDSPILAASVPLVPVHPAQFYVPPTISRGSAQVLFMSPYVQYNYVL